MTSRSSPINRLDRRQGRSALVAGQVGSGGDPAPNAWHAEDRLLAEVRSDIGTLLSVLSVDMPRNGLLPGPWEREVLALYAREAGVALTTARLRAAAERMRPSAVGKVTGVEFPQSA